jgi:hypothetical protein
MILKVLITLIVAAALEVGRDALVRLGLAGRIGGGFIVTGGLVILLMT